MRFRPEVDYYEILQVHPRASPEMIKKAYRTLMGEMRGHPDLGGDVERAKLINEAHTVLSDSELRRAYDIARNGRASWWGQGAGSAAGGDLERWTALARKVVLSVTVVVAALALARVLKSPTLDLADLIAMIFLLMRIWSQVSLPGRAS